MQDKINISQNRSVLQRFLGESILSYGLRNSIYMQFLGSTSLYHKEDSFVAPEVFDSSFLDLELVYKMTVVTQTGVTKTPSVNIYIPKSLPRSVYLLLLRELHLPEYFQPCSHWINTHIHFWHGSNQIDLLHITANLFSRNTYIQVNWLWLPLWLREINRYL